MKAFQETGNRFAALVLATAMLSGCAATLKDSGPVRGHAPGAYPTIDASAPKSQCVPFARAMSGVNIFGDAHTWWDQAKRLYRTKDEPRPGAVIVMKGRTDDRGHVAVVRKILNDRQITVDHANWGNEKEVQRDTPVLDVSAGNDWTAVRVWHIQSRQFGGTIYAVEGFILPERRASDGFLW